MTTKRLNRNERDQDVINETIRKLQELDDAITTGGRATINRSSSVATIASGNMPATATLTISAIPNYYSYLIIRVSGWSQNTNTAALYVRIGTGGVDSTAGTYVGNTVTGTTVTNFTTNARASIVDGGTQTIAQTGTADIYLYGYQSASAKHFQSRILSAATEATSMGFARIGTAIDTIEVGTTAAGNFDAGTYALYGVL